MLAKENRLRLKKDFERVFKEGKGFREDCLLLKIKENNLRVSRFGFVIGKKISKKASQRNKIKRRLREIIRKELREIKKGYDGILIARPGIGKKDFAELEKMIKKLLKKAKISKS